MIGGNRLIDAAFDGNLQTVQEILSEGKYPLNAVDAHPKNSALMWAAEKGRGEIVDRLLLEPEIDVTLRNIFNRSAADLAEDNGHTEIAAQLRKFGEKPSQQLKGRAGF